MNNAFYIIVQRINLYEIFHTKDTNLFHRSFYPISTREESKSNECRSKTRKMIPYSRYERRRRRRQEKKKRKKRSMVGNRNTPRRLRFARELRSSQSVNFLVVFIATKRRGAQRPTHAHATMHEHMCDPVARTALSQPVCTLRLRSAKGDGLLIGRGGNDSASPRPRDRENHRFPSIYSFEGRECVVLSLTFFSSLRPRRLNDYLLPRSSIERFANRRIQGNLMGRNFFFFFLLFQMKYL